MTNLEYWRECIIATADDCDISLTEREVDDLAEGVNGGYENHGLAFHSPSSDRGPSPEALEWKSKFERLQAEFDTYRNNAETAVKKALDQYPSSQVSIEENGDVYRIGGRTEQIQ